MKPIIKKVYDTITQNNMLKKNDSVVVGFSGGADSLFLMLALLELKNHCEFEIYAAHINHGIRGNEADRDESFVFDFCKKNRIKLFTKKICIPELAKEQKVSEEIAGRNERYKFFNEICKTYGIKKIAVAHNKNDSVETVILNMIRGASLPGLCGIKPVNGNVIRPIIGVSRDEIEQYLENEKYDYCTDSTNFTDIYNRNKIRNTILKKMADINPSVIDTIHSNLFNLNNDERFLTEYCDNLNCITRVNKDIEIKKDVFEKQHIAIKHRLILKAFEMLKGNCVNVSSKHLEIISNADSVGKTYDMPDNVKVVISYDKIKFSYGAKQNIFFEYDIKNGDKFHLFNNIYISAVYCDKLDINNNNAIFIDADKIKSEKLIVRSRKDGDKFVPYGLNKEKKIKEYFINLKIPVYERDKVPILSDGTEIAAVIPYRVSELYKVDSDTKNILKLELTKEK